MFTTYVPRCIYIPQCFYVPKNYDVELIDLNGTYQHNTQWIADWYYTQYEPDHNVDNVKFHIKGDFHSTFPNPPHLTIKISKPDGSSSEWLHISRDKNGGYLQQLYGGQKEKLGSKRKKTGKKTGKKTRKKKIS
jgi:hypothetical protein